VGRGPTGIRSEQQKDGEFIQQPCDSNPGSVIPEQGTHQLSYGPNFVEEGVLGLMTNKKSTPCADENGDGLLCWTETRRQRRKDDLEGDGLGVGDGATGVRDELANSRTRPDAQTLDEDALENLMATEEMTCSARPCRLGLATGVQGRRGEHADGDVDGQKRCGRWMSRRALLLCRFDANHANALA
jgi:hypothetical protein